MVIPIVFLGIYLINGTNNMLSDYHADMMHSDNTRVKNFMYEYTSQIDHLSEYIIQDSELDETLSSDYSSADAFRKKADKITTIQNYRGNGTYAGISDVIIYTDNPGIVDYRQINKVTEDIAGTSWYKRASSSAGVFWTTIVKKNTTGVPMYCLSLVRMIPLSNSDYHAVLVMHVSDDYLRSSLEINSYETYLSVGNNKIFYSTRRSEEGEEMPLDIDFEKAYYSYTGEFEREGNICFAEINTLNIYKTNSKLYILTINNEGYNEIWDILKKCLIIIALAIALPGILIVFSTHYLTGRVNVLRNEMHKASRRDYELLPVLSGKDEISEAYRDLMVMVENIKANEAQVYESQIKSEQLESSQREMEYKMLASQINPHFLYNTLETIRMKAFTAGDKEVAAAIKLLGKSMRYVLENIGTARTTLAEELEHVEVYLNIEKLRFGDRFDYSFEVEEGIDTKEIYLLPLLLQPLVENSMVHGLENLEKNGTVNIFIHLDEENKELLKIDIKDNGDGMSFEELMRLRENINVRDVSRRQSIGLYNINQRVKLLYGENYPLVLDSRKGVGTTASLTIPLNMCQKD